MTLSLWQSALLGALQGATEFLPVSSSGHLVLLREMLGVGEVPLLFDVLLHLSTLAAVGVVFRRRLADLVGAAGDWLRPPARRRAGRAADRRLLQLLLLATVATGGVGFAVQRLGLPREPRFVALMLLATAALLVAARVLGGAAQPRPHWRPRWPWGVAGGRGAGRRGAAGRVSLRCHDRGGGGRRCGSGDGGGVLVPGRDTGDRRCAGRIAAGGLRRLVPQSAPRPSPAAC